jgi:guanylate kinase
VGKGTIVRALIQRDPRLWLSRSWTTRERRPGEAEDAYTWASRNDFEARIAAGGFVEWTEFLGHLYGTPDPEAPPGHDIVLEIEVDGAGQVKARHPDALLLFVLPPTREEQERRLRGRGDPEPRVLQRLHKAEQEEPVGKAMADVVVVNDELDRTVDELIGIIDRERRQRARV